MARSTMVDLARQYPLMTTSVVAATTGLTALAAAAGGGALMQLLLLRGAGKIPTGVVPTTTTKPTAIGRVLSKLPSAKLAKGLPLLGLGLGALEVANVARDKAI